MNLIEDRKLTYYETFYNYRIGTESDIDDNEETKELYRILGMLTNDKIQRGDTFHLNSYVLVNQLCRKYDYQFYTNDYKRFIASEGLNYYSLQNNEAKIMRCKWYLELTTQNHYPFLRSDALEKLYEVNHSIGNFVVLGPRQNNLKMNCFNDDGALYLRYLEQDWINQRIFFNNIEWNEYLSLMHIEDFPYMDDRYAIYKNDSFETILDKITLIVNYVLKRNERLEAILANKKEQI